MTKREQLQLFDARQVRTVWDDEQEKWYFSIVDVVSVLTESIDPKQYIKKMKARDQELNSSWGTICTLTKMKAADGKRYQTQVATIEGILRIIQSIPSHKAEPFKLWLAKVGSERLDEIVDPEKAILRGAEYYRAKGYSEGWINQRLQTIEMRKELTDEWKARGITKEKEFAILTNDMTQAWSGLSVKEYKQVKNLKKENLRDNMTNLELVLNMLAEVTTTSISRARHPESFRDSRSIAKEGGSVAGNTRKDIERRLGRSVISSQNATDKPSLEIKSE